MTLHCFSLHYFIWVNLHPTLWYLLSSFYLCTVHAYSLSDIHNESRIRLLWKINCFSKCFTTVAAAVFMMRRESTLTAGSVQSLILSFTLHLEAEEQCGVSQRDINLRHTMTAKDLPALSDSFALWEPITVLTDATQQKWVLIVWK